MVSGLIPGPTGTTARKVYRTIAGDTGARWTPGDAEHFAHVLVAACSADLGAQRAATKARFDQALSWKAIGARTVAEYRTLARI